MNTEYKQHILTLIAERITKQDFLSVAILQYIQNFEPAQSLDDKDAFLLSSDRIRDKVSEIVDVSINDISRLLVLAGFSLVVDRFDDDQPGWLVKKSD